MAQWQIKELSKLTGVTVRTLHHYDHLGLLMPSVRSANRYRWYSEEDLMKLQQILALKSFGFGLDQIKTMLHDHPQVLQQLRVQKQMLGEQIEQISQIVKAITSIVEQTETSNAPDWKSTLKLIGRYRMKMDLEKTWARKLSENQLREYLLLREEHPKEMLEWDLAVTEINSMQLGDPEGPDGERMATLFFDFHDKIKKSLPRLRKLNADAMSSIKDGSLTELPLTSEGHLWMTKALIAHSLRYWDALYNDIVKNLGKDPLGPDGKRVAKAWRDLIDKSLVGMPPKLATGITIWQEALHKKSVVQELAGMSYQEQLKYTHVKLLFNPEALSWIEQALNA